MKRSLFLIIAVLALVGMMFMPSPAFAQVQATALVPSPDQIAGQWMLTQSERITLEIRVAVNGSITGMYRAKDMADGAADRHPITGAMVNNEVRIKVVGTGHPGYTLKWVSPDTLRGHLVGIPTEERVFLRRLLFTGQDPS